MPTASEPDATVYSLQAPERIHALALELQRAIKASLDKTTQLSTRMRLLALNARIEACHAGPAGAGFSVVAQEMVHFSTSTSEVFRGLESESQKRIEDLVAISNELASTVRGTRLTDLAHTNIDLVDRCLYERTCDVRWWATDAAVVEAVQRPCIETATRCCDRLGVILKAYTVYHDIVVCDMSGRVLANGKGDRFESIGSDCSHTPWFQAARATANGDEFGFQSGHRSPLVDNAPVLAYSCRIGRDGDARGTAQGVLCVFFNWGDFASRILSGTPIAGEERASTRIALFDTQGVLLADSSGQELGSRIDLPNLPALFAKGRSFQELKLDGKPTLVAFAPSPGFETYATGWGSVILQEF